MLSDLPKVPHLVSGKTGIETQASEGTWGLSQLSAPYRVAEAL